MQQLSKTQVGFFRFSIYKVLIIDTMLFLKLLKDHCYVMYCLYFPNMRAHIYDTLVLIQPVVSYLFKVVIVH
jgi:hypothetical protein